MKYNIISNNCLGGFVYRNLLHTEYGNPFIWTLFDDDTFINFIKHFYTINLRHVCIKKASSNWNIDNDFDTIIANKYIIHNIHMHFNASHPSPVQCNPPTSKYHHLWTSGVSYRYIWEYIYERYCDRLQRMINNNVDPILMYWGVYNGVKCTDEQIENLCSTIQKLNYKAIIFDRRVTQYNTNRCIIVPDNTNWVIPRHIIDEHSTNIMRWLDDLSAII